MNPDVDINTGNSRVNESRDVNAKSSSGDPVAGTPGAKGIAMVGA